MDQNKNWRQQIVEIPANSLVTLEFQDTTPNVVLVTNYSTESVYIGIKNIPKATEYEFIVKGNTSETVGQPTGFSRMYFFNDSDNEIKVNTMSCYDGAFDITKIKSFNININSAEIITKRPDAYFTKKATIAPAGSDEQAYTFSEITLIANDGLNDLTVKFKSIAGTYGGEITLKPSEYLTMNMKGSGYLVASTAGTDYRIILNGGI